MWYKVRVQFHSFSHGYAVFPTPLIGEVVFSPLCILGIFVKDQSIVYAWVYFWDLDSVPLVYESGFYAITILFQLLKLYNIVWNREVWILQLHSSFSRLLCLFRVLCREKNSIWILGLFFPSSVKSSKKNTIKNGQNIWVDMFAKTYRFTNNQKVYEKMLNVTNHQGNANKNQNEIKLIYLKGAVTQRQVSSW